MKPRYAATLQGARAELTHGIFGSGIGLGIVTATCDAATCSTQGLHSRVHVGLLLLHDMLYGMADAAGSVAPHTHGR